MRAGDIYTITNGKYSDKYLVVFSGPIGYSLKRVRLPKTKIDGVRLNENIHINFNGSTIPEKKKK